MYDDRRPYRRQNNIQRKLNFDSWQRNNTAHAKRQLLWYPDAPQTFVLDDDFLADSIVRSVYAILDGTAVPDPTVVVNAMFGDIVSRRVDRIYPHDEGRMGIQVTDAQTRIPLVVAGKLVLKQQERAASDKISSTPVVLYYRTVAHALLASRDLWWLKRQQAMAKESSNDTTEPSCYDQILIRTLGDSLPEVYIDQKDNQSSRKKPHLQTGATNATHGFCLLVEPFCADDSLESQQPPYPGVRMSALQSLVAQAALAQVPVLHMAPSQSDASNSLNNRNSWLMRDFKPPVCATYRYGPYFWVWHSVTLPDRAWHIYTTTDAVCANNAPDGAENVASIQPQGSCAYVGSTYQRPTAAVWERLERQRVEGEFRREG